MDWRDPRGYALFALVLIGIGVVIVVIGLGSLVAFWGDKGVVPVDENVCQCPDLDDMNNRVKEAGAAVAAFAQMANTQAATDLAAGTTTMYSNALYLQGTATAKTAVIAAHTAGARSGNGETGSDCVTKVNAPTACLQASFQTHENVHSAACQALKASGTVANLGDYKDAMTIVDYWRQEVSAYSAELMYLSRQITRVAADPACAKPPPVAVSAETYRGAESTEDQKERLAGARRRVTSYVAAII